MLIQTFMFWGSFSLSVLVLALFFTLLTPFVKDRTRIAQRCVRAACRVILFVSGVRYALEGKGNIPEGRGAIFAANHNSFIDSIILLAELPPVRITVFRAGLSVPLIRKVFGDAGYVGVGMKEGRNLEQFFKLAKAVGKEESVLNYGIPSKNDEIGTFTSGVSVLSRVSGMPVLPVAIKGTSSFMPLERFYFKRSKIEVKIGEPLDLSGCPDDSSGELIRSEIKKLYG